AGTDTLRIEGVEKLTGVTHTVIPDRVEAGTYLSIAAAMGEDVLVENVIGEHIESLVAKMTEMGVPLEIQEESVRVLAANEKLNPITIKTLPYPGFATDLQQPITPLLIKTAGESVIIDTIYPKRVNHIPELKRMDADIRDESDTIIIKGLDKQPKNQKPEIKQMVADIRVESDTILIKGVDKLTGTQVKASDLRAGACLVTAALMAEGTTEITGVENILRGYSNIVEKLTALGADIQMVETKEKIK